MYSLGPVEAADAWRYAPLTIGSLRPMLARLREDQTAIGFRADLLGRPVGLALGRAFNGGGVAVLNSLFVTREQRGRGLGTALIGGFEQAARDLGCADVYTRYPAGKAWTASFERVLEKRGWEPPATCTLMLKLDLERLMGAPWMSAGCLPPGFSFFPWSELTEEDRRSIAARHAAEPWVYPEVDPFRNERPFIPESSLGLRHQADVVGWIVNRPVDEITGEVSPAWVRPDLRRVGRCVLLVALVRESVRRALLLTPHRYAYLTPVRPEMYTFAERWMAPYAATVREIKSAHKLLG